MKNKTVKTLSHFQSNSVKQKTTRTSNLNSLPDTSSSTGMLPGVESTLFPDYRTNSLRGIEFTHESGIGERGIRICGACDKRMERVVCSLY
jgi:hypothetical protein